MDLTDSVKQHWSTDATLLPMHLGAVKEARSAQLKETQTWGQMLINRPASLAKTGGPGGHMILNANDVIELGINVYHEAARTAGAQVCKPLNAVAISVGGDYEQQQACDGATHWLRGALDMIGWHAVATGLTKQAMWATESHAIIAIDPVTKDPETVTLDPTEGFWTQDRTEFVCSRAVSRRWLKATYAKGNDELRGAIDRLPGWNYDAMVGVDADKQFSTEDTVRLYEAWQAPMGNERGKHVVMASADVVFVDEPFDGEIPVASTNWDTGARGRSDGAPLGRIVGPYHCWINKLTHKVYEGLKGAVPWVRGPAGTKMPSDAPFQFVESSDTDPAPVDVYMPKTVSMEVLAERKELKGDVARATGISEEASQGSPPANLKSGVAISKWEAVLEGSLSAQHSAYKRLWIDAARILLSLAAKSYANNPVNVRRAAGSDVIEQIKWSEINLKEDQFVVDFDAVSALGDTVSQRIENVQVLKDLAIIDIPDMVRHIDLPDLRALSKRLNGPRNYLEYQINQALRHAKVEAPGEFQDMVAGLRIVGEAMQEMLSAPNRPPRQNMEALRILWRLFKRAAAVVQQPAAPAPAMPGVPTTAAPTPLAPGPIA